MAGELEHRCGVFGVIGDEDVAINLMVGAESLQHRGRQGAGMAISNSNGRLLIRQGPGEVPVVFDPEAMRQLIAHAGNMGISHVLWSTWDANNHHYQPILRPETGLTFTQNGNLPVVDGMRQFLEASGVETASFNDTK